MVSDISPSSLDLILQYHYQSQLRLIVVQALGGGVSSLNTPKTEPVELVVENLGIEIEPGGYVVWELTNSNSMAYGTRRFHAAFTRTLQ